MKPLTEILDLSRPDDQIIADLQQKSIIVPPWTLLQKEYYPKQHPVFDLSQYPDVIQDDGSIDRVTRIGIGLQRLAVKRMSELMYTIPQERKYTIRNENDKIIASVIDKILERNHINNLNLERARQLFASCEVVTLWYAVEEENTIYGVKSPIKIRCRTFSPMKGDILYPLFDTNDDMTALSVSYQRNYGQRSISYFDSYTKDHHLRWSNEHDTWSLDINEAISIGKIPGTYIFRPDSIWEDTSSTVFESEWSLSRNGNYLRKNSKPVFCLFADEEASFGNERNEKEEFKGVFQYPKGSSAQYVTWDQAIENLKFFISELRQSFFTQLQLPDWSYESLKSIPMSGESRKQLFIDAQLKVGDEQGRFIEMHEREISVIKQFIKPILPDISADQIDSLECRIIITPYSITDEKDTVSNCSTAVGGKAICSRRDAITKLGWSKDIDATIKDIEEEEKASLFDPTV